MTLLYLPEYKGDPARAELAAANGKMLFTALDPASAEILQAGGYGKFPLEAALQLHYRL